MQNIFFKYAGLFICFILFNGCSQKNDKISNYIITDYHAYNLANKYLCFCEEENIEDCYTGNLFFNRTFKDAYDEETKTIIKKEKRDEMIIDLFIVSDYLFHKYTNNLSSQKKYFNFGSEAYSLLLTGTASLTTGGSTPNILSSLATFYTGTNEIYNKTFFREKTIGSITKVMASNRNNKKIEIYKKMKNDIAKYSLMMALSDILIMGYEGSLENALRTLEKDSTEKVGSSELLLKQARDAFINSNTYVKEINKN